MKNKEMRMPCGHALAVALTLAAALDLAAPAIGTADTIYVSIQPGVSGGGTNAIEKFTSDGAGSIFAYTASAYPRGLVIDTAGNFYVASALWNRIEQFTPGGVGTIFANTNLSGPMGLALDRAGNLFVANWGTNTIVKFTPNGVGSTFATNGLNNPFGLAFDSAGNLFVSNWGDGTIVKFTPDGIGSIFASLPGPAHLTGLAVDATNNLYVLYGSTIQKFTPGGVRSVFVKGTPGNGLATPFGLAIDSAGDVYVANESSNTVLKFTPDGTGSVFANTGSSNPVFIAIPLLPPPLLRVESMGTNTLLVGWPAPSTGFALQQNTDLATTNWTSVANQPVPVGSEYQVILSPTGARNFYRLTRP